MPTILARRGNHAGPSAADENRLKTLESALEQGWGLEVDIRRAPDGRFYLSHDPQAPADDQLAAPFFAAVRRHPGAVVALNIRELGDESALVDCLSSQHVLRQCFVVGMELLEPVVGCTARQFRRLHPYVRLAARVSDRRESIDRALGISEATVIWLDEFDRSWATEADIRRLHAAGRTVHAASPDLHGGSLAAARARWRDFMRWGVDGICTGYPIALADELASVLQGVSA
jgi:glycerophosphoryl diester phosphodiesterase